MDNHSALAGVSACLLDLLRKHCSPDPVRSADKIGLISQSDSTDFALSLMLYDIRPMDRGLFPEDVFPLCLKYIVMADSQAVPEVKAAEETRILGRAIWTFANFPVLDKDLLNNNGAPVSIIMDNLSLDEKTRVFSTSNCMKPSAFYYVSPVLISLEGGDVAARVRSVR